MASVETGLPTCTRVREVALSCEASTASEPERPSRIDEPATRGWPPGTCGTTSSRPRPMSGRTPSCWCTTGHAVP